MIDHPELFPSTICSNASIEVPQRARSQTLYFGPKSGYKCVHCEKEYYNIRHLNTHVRNNHNFVQKIMDLVRK